MSGWGSVRNSFSGAVGCQITDVDDAKDEILYLGFTPWSPRRRFDPHFTKTIVLHLPEFGKRDRPHILPKSRYDRMNAQANSTAERPRQGKDG